MTASYWSIFFATTVNSHISFLERSDAERLLCEPVAGVLDIDPLAVEKIIDLTRGHPYFIQLIGWTLVNHCNRQERNYATINDVNDTVHEMLASNNAYLAHIWQEASTDKQLALVALTETLRSGKDWAPLADIQDTLVSRGDTLTRRSDLAEALDQLVAQEVLETAEGATPQYRFKLELVRMWIASTKSVTGILDRRS